MDKVYIIRILRYFTIFAAIYLIARFNPKTELSNTNCILISLTVVILYIMSEYVYNRLYNTSVKSKCSNNLCNIEEKFANNNLDKNKKSSDSISNIDSKLDLMNKKMNKLEDDLHTMKEKKEDNNKNDDSSSFDDGSDYEFTDNNAYSKDNPSEYIRTKINYANYHNLPYTSDSDAQYGYSYLPPSNWYKQPPQPPVCVQEKRCPVCPNMSTPGYTNLLEVEDANDISKPMGINTDYINKKLNLKEKKKSKK